MDHMECSNECHAPIDSLPAELMVTIFSYVQPIKLVTASACCKYWRSLIMDEPSMSLLVWRGVWENTFGAHFEVTGKASSYRNAAIKASKTLEQRAKAVDYDMRGSHVIFTENDAHASDRLCWAARNGHTAYVQRLLSSLKRSPNLKSIVNEWRLQVESSLTASPLFLAAQEKHFEIARLLIEHGADVNAQAADDDAATPLLAAIQSGSYDIVKLFLDSKADPNKSTAELSPLYIAAQNGTLSICSLLISYGAQVNRRLEKYGITPLFIAAQNGHLSIIKLLLENQADLTIARYSDGATPMSISRLARDPKVYEFFQSLPIYNATP